MRLIFGAFFITLSLLLASAQGQVTGSVESIGFGGDYRPGCWTPMIVRLNPNGAPTGFYELRVWQHDLDGDLPYFSTRISLTATAGEQPFWTYFIPEPIKEGLTTDTSTRVELSARLRITIHDAAGKELAQIPLGNATLRSIEQPSLGTSPARATRLVLFVDPTASPAIADFDPSRLLGVKEDLTPERIGIERLPENVIGYDGVDAVVWLGGDPATLSASGGQRFDALRAFVRRGGHLVISTPSQWQQLAGFDDLMPVDLTGIEQNKQQSPIRELAARVPFFNGTPGAPAQNPWERYKATQSIAVASLRPGAVVDEYSDRIADPVEAGDRTPWLVRHAYGFGCVSWVAQDLGSRELLDRANWGWPAVWEEILGASSSPIVFPRLIDKQRFRAIGQREFGFAAVDAMNLTGRAVTLIGITVGFFIAYWAIAGPGAFFWLRYKDRSTLNWFAFGAVALVATAATLGLVKVVLRGKPELKHLSLVRVDGDLAKPARIISDIGIYVPRDGPQRIEIPATPAASSGESPPTLVPFPIHPVIHHANKGDAYLYPAPREYRVQVASDEASHTASEDVPFRTTMKRMQAQWSGSVEDRIEGNIALQPSVGNVGYISGTLRNLTGKDLHNVYVAFRHQPPGGRPTDWMMYTYQLKAGDTLDLAKAFNPQGDKSPGDITVDVDKRIGPNPEFPVRGWLSQWAALLAPTVRADTMGGSSPVSDLDSEIPLSVPMLSLFNRFPTIQNASVNAAEFTSSRAELLRSGVRDWDVSNALMAGGLIVIAQADRVPIPIPFTVEGEAVAGSGRTIYQFVLPLTPLSETVTTRPTTRSASKSTQN